MKRILCLFLLAGVTAHCRADIQINEVMSSNSQYRFGEKDETPDWIELHHIGSQPMFLKSCYLTDKRDRPRQWQCPDTLLRPGDYLVILASGNSATPLNANFKLNAAGEFLALTHENGSVIDSLFIPPLPANISYGRSNNTWQLMDHPTPGQANDKTVYTPAPDPPQFSHESGFYQQPLTVELNADTNLTIYYTIDGSMPDMNAAQYNSAIPVTRTTVIRTVSVSTALKTSRIQTRSFILGENTGFALVSLVTDPDNLWDWDEGLFEMGDNARTDYPYYGANFWQDWEKPVHIELFEPDGTRAIQTDAGLKIFGGWSRGRPQKSMALFARSIYGDSEFDYPIFPDKAIESYESFVLRNGGNDWDQSLFRDGMMQYLIKDVMDVPMLAFRPALCFINGEYWGILNLREKINEHYLKANEHADADALNLLSMASWRTSPEAIIGSNEDYNALIRWIRNHPLSDDNNYDKAASELHIRNFMEYHIAQIYFENQDWPGNNNKFWKPSNRKGKWRWILYDTDFGFSIYGRDNWKHNTLAFALEAHGPQWPNPPHSTFLLRNLIQNETFMTAFINCFADHLNSTFAPERVIGIIENFEHLFYPEIDRHRTRWPGAMGDFEHDMEIMKQFAAHRPDYLREFIVDQFDLNGLYTLTLNTDTDQTGGIQVNDIDIDQFPWNGIYFQNVPILLKAVPAPGFCFAQWSDGLTNPGRILNTGQNTALTAVFEKAVMDSQQIVINEINYCDSDVWQTGDWIELHNPADVSVDLGGWVLQDSDPDQIFVFPAETQLPPQGYLLAARDLKAVNLLHPGLKGIDGLPFKLDNQGETIKLIRNDLSIADSLSYSPARPWPAEAAGQGPTLECVDPQRDNTDPANWKASLMPGGTPGQKNSVNTGISQEVSQKQPADFTLSPNFPNPFNGQTQFLYYLNRPARVKCQIFDITGKKVRVLIDHHQPAGLHSLVWDGMTDSGVSASTGTYLIHWSDGVMSKVTKAVMMK